MKAYRKKPVVIQAVQVEAFWFERMPPITQSALVREHKLYGLTFNNRDKTISISTLEGVMTAQVGDYIIRGIKGELYPCKPDIFEASYEPTDEAPTTQKDGPSRARPSGTS